MKPDEGFSLSSLIPAGMGNKVALTKELETRQRREKAIKPDGWVYAGPADYILREGRYIPARVLPDHYDDLIGAATECHLNSVIGAERSGLRYFTGYYLVGQIVGHHSWLMDDDGVVEVTFPTKGIAPGTMVAPYLSSASVPYVGPERWAYFGLEFDVAFIRRAVDEFDGTLPLLENDSILHADAMSHRYSVHGWPLS